jgi:hypothetical protein
MISAGYRWPLYDTSPTLIPLRRIDSEIIHFGRTNHQPDNAVADPPCRPRREIHVLHWHNGLAAFSLASVAGDGEGNGRARCC